MSERITLHSPADVVASIPDLIGFYPDQSLVALWTADPSGTLIATMRMDLGTPGVVVSQKLADVCVGPGRLLISIYSARLADWIDSTHELALQSLIEAVRLRGIDVTEVLLVSEGRYWSLLCQDPDCCPPEGRPIPSATTAIEAQLVSDGRLATADSRETVTARYALRPDLTPPPQLVIRVGHDIRGTLRQRCDYVLDLITRLPGVRRDGDLARAQYMLLVQDLDVRDYLLASLATAAPHPAAVDAVVTTALAAPDPLRPRLAGMAAALLYAAGDSPVGVWAMLEHAGEDSLGRLVEASMDSCVPPTALREVFGEAVVIIEERMAAEVA